MSAEEEFPATWEGGHALIMEFGDCELFGRCQCSLNKPFPKEGDFGYIRPNGDVNTIVQKWERHVMTRSQS